MSTITLFNYKTEKHEKIEPDSITVEQGLNYVPVFIDTVEESYREYIELGLTPIEAIRLVSYEVMLALRDVLMDKVEQNMSTQESE